MLSSKEEVLRFLERHKDVGYTVYELMKEIEASESSIRKSLHQLVQDNIITTVGEDPAYYGFVGMACNQVSKCNTVVQECMVYAYRCEKRLQLEGSDNEREDEEENDEQDDGKGE